MKLARKISFSPAVVLVLLLAVIISVAVLQSQLSLWVVLIPMCIVGVHYIVRIVSDAMRIDLTTDGYDLSMTDIIDELEG